MATDLISGYSSPLRFKKNLRPGVVHPLDGLPIEIIAQLDDVVDHPIVQYFDHFTAYSGPTAEGSAAEWTLVGTTGVATVSVLGQDYGAIELSTGTSADDNAVLRQTSMTFNYDTTNNMWVAVRLNLSDADDMEAYVGITADNGDFVAGLPAHGLFFEKAETATNWDFHVRDDGTSTENTADFTGLTIADATDMILVIRVENGNITPHVHTASTGWISGTTVASSDANVPGTTDDMRFHVALETGAAAAGTSQIDWVLLAKER